MSLLLLVVVVACSHSNCNFLVLISVYSYENKPIDKTKNEYMHEHVLLVDHAADKTRCCHNCDSQSRKPPSDNGTIAAVTVA